MNTTIALQRRQPLEWLGRRWEWEHAAVAGIGSFLLCYLYVLGTRQWSPEFEPGVVEFWGTMTSLWCVWITQKRNILSLPIGIVSVVLMGWFFMTIDLQGQMMLQWFFYIPVQIWAWQHWCRGGEDNTELRVKTLNWTQRGLVVAAAFVLTYLVQVVLVTGWDNPTYAYWDASIVAASITAQFLLADKRVESWIFWILPVNVSAIGLYLKTGANMFAALYCLFLVMAFVGLYRWANAARKEIV